MHALGWSQVRFVLAEAWELFQEEAVEYMLEHTAASEQNVRNEVTR